MFKTYLALRKAGLVWGAVVAAATVVATPALAQQNNLAPVTTPANAPAGAQKEDFSRELDLLFKAFQTRDYVLLKPLLDAKTKVGSLPQGMNDLIMPQLLKQLPEPVSYAVTTVAPEGDATRVSMVYNYANGKALTQSVVFDADHKITALDLPTSFKAQALNTDGGTRVTPDKIEVPFELRNHLIRVSAELNGKKGSFLFDSGAPTLVLNADLLAPDQLQGSGAVAGVGGAVSARASHVDTFNWNGLKISDFYAVALPLGNIGAAGHVTDRGAVDGGDSFLGLIGYSVFKDYEVTFDYERKLMTLVRTDKLGEPVVAIAAPEGKVSVVPFEMHRHIPVFAMKIGDKSYPMGLDSGAGENLFYAKYWADVQKYVSHVTSQTLAGVGKEKASAKLAALRDVEVGAAHYRAMFFAFEDGNLNQLNNGYQLGIDGLLGYGFLRQHVTTINYKKNQLRIYDRAPGA